MYESPFTFPAGQQIDRSLATLPITSGSGVAANSTATEREPLVRQTTLTIASQNVALVDGGASGAQGSLKILDLPAKKCLIVGAQLALTTLRVGTNLQATAACVFALGTVAPAADATLTGTEANIIPSTAGTLVAGAGTVDGLSTGPVHVAANSDVLLNIAVPDAGSTGNDSLTIAGTATIIWIALP